MLGLGGKIGLLFRRQRLDPTAPGLGRRFARRLEVGQLAFDRGFVRGQFFKRHFLREPPQEIDVLNLCQQIHAREHGQVVHQTGIGVGQQPAGGQETCDEGDAAADGPQPPPLANRRSNFGGAQFLFLLRRHRDHFDRRAGEIVAGLVAGSESSASHAWSRSCNCSR